MTAFFFSTFFLAYRNVGSTFSLFSGCHFFLLQSYLLRVLIAFFWMLWIVKEGRICRAGLHLLKYTLTIILGSSLRDCMVTLYNSIWSLECSVSSGLRSISTAHNLSKEKLSNGCFFRRVLRPRLQFLFIFGGFFMKFITYPKYPFTIPFFSLVSQLRCEPSQTMINPIFWFWLIMVLAWIWLNKSFVALKVHRQSESLIYMKVSFCLLSL